MSAIIGRIWGGAKAHAELEREKIQLSVEEKLGLAYYETGERREIRKDNESSIRRIYDAKLAIEEKFDELMAMVERNNDALEPRDDENLRRFVIAQGKEAAYLQKDFLTLAYYDRLVTENPSNFNKDVARNIREAITRNFIDFSELWITAIRCAAHGKPEHVPDVLAVTKVPSPFGAGANSSTGGLPKELADIYSKIANTEETEDS